MIISLDGFCFHSIHWFIHWFSAIFFFFFIHFLDYVIKNSHYLHHHHHNGRTTMMMMMTVVVRILFFLIRISKAKKKTTKNTLFYRIDIDIQFPMWIEYGIFAFYPGSMKEYFFFVVGNLFGNIVPIGTPKTKRSTWFIAMLI